MFPAFTYWESLLFSIDQITAFLLVIVDEPTAVQNWSELSPGNKLLAGIMINSGGQAFRVSVYLPDLVNKKSVIRFLAKSLWDGEVRNIWQTRTREVEYYWTKFDFMALDEGDSETVKQLISLVK